MVLKVLSDEELALLDDNQRMWYEKEFDLHQQRLEFVEQLEVLENATIEPYEPKLEPIVVIGEIDVKPFKNPEHVLVACEPVVKPELQVNPFKKPESVEPVLPLAPKRPIVQVGHIQKQKRTKPKLPLISKPASVKRRFKKPEIKHPSLLASTRLDITAKPFKKLEGDQTSFLAIIEPSIKTARHFGLSKKEWRRKQDRIPRFSIPPIGSVPFAMPEETQHSLQKVSALLTKAKPFNIPEQPNVELPSVARPGIAVNPPKKVKRAKPRLPKLAKPGAQARDFIKPERPEPELPSVAKLYFGAKTFKQPERSRPTIITSKAPSITAKAFTKLERSAPQLPKRNTVVAPDAEARLKELLSLESANSEVLEG